MKIFDKYLVTWSCAFLLHHKASCSCRRIVRLLPRFAAAAAGKVKTGINSGAVSESRADATSIKSTNFLPPRICTQNVNISQFQPNWIWKWRLCSVQLKQVNMVLASSHFIFQEGKVNLKGEGKTSRKKNAIYRWTSIMVLGLDWFNWMVRMDHWVGWGIEYFTILHNKKNALLQGATGPALLGAQEKNDLVYPASFPSKIWDLKRRQFKEKTPECELIAAPCWQSSCSVRWRQNVSEKVRNGYYQRLSWKQTDFNRCPVFHCVHVEFVKL